MKINRAKLAALPTLVCWVMFSVVPLSFAVINQPARIGGTLTVNGVQITQATDDGYMVVITDTSGTPFQDVQGKLSQDDDGLNTFNYYIVDIPIFDASDQPKGAKPGSAAIIHVYLNSQELSVTSPSGGSLIVPVMGTTTTINLATATTQSPIADAGPDQTVKEGVLVTLDGSNSSDPDGTIVSYLWEQTAGPSVTLSSTTVLKPTFTSPNVGVAGAALTFQLTVTDNQGLKSQDTCIINVTWVNVPPVADAGPDQTVKEGVTVTLDGSNSSDTEDGIASYLWAQKTGPTVTLSSTTAVKPTFIAPNVGASGEALTFELTVTDNHGLKSQDTCIINVTWANVPPVADAGPDQTVKEGVTVTLDGSNSTDPDDGIASYLWTQEAGPSVTLSSTAAVEPTFTSPDVGVAGAPLTFQLTVTDQHGLQSKDTCIVNVTWVNVAPTANAGKDQTVLENTVVTLDASGSTDPDDGIASYLWKQTQGSPVTLSDPQAQKPAFTAPDVDQTNVLLTFQVTVTDNHGLKSADSCTVTVTPATEDKPDLTPYKPSAWSDKIVVSNKAGTTTDDSPLLTTDTLYVDWAVANLGKAATEVKFYYDLFVDGVKKHTWYSDPPVNPNTYSYVLDYSIGSLTAGVHTIKIVADSTNVIAERNETDNSYTKEITVTESTVKKPNLTPYKPDGWSDKIVVSKKVDTTTDDSPLLTTDTLYVDWAVINSGNAATEARVYFKLSITAPNGDKDSNTWYLDPPFNPNTYGQALDWSVGSFAAGVYTIEFAADTTKAIPESNETDNRYTKTFTVTSVVARTLKVTRPNGGESWQAGTAQTIRWKYTGKPYPTVKIQLLKKGKVIKTLAKSVPLGSAGRGFFKWHIPLTQTPGTNYKISIISNSIATCKDVSNRTFTIRSQ
jgi:NAD-dependent SIR2 family protein deacetylase